MHPKFDCHVSLIREAYLDDAATNTKHARYKAGYRADRRVSKSRDRVPVNISFSPHIPCLLRKESVDLKATIQAKLVLLPIRYDQRKGGGDFGSCQNVG